MGFKYFHQQNRGVNVKSTKIRKLEGFKWITKEPVFHSSKDKYFLQANELYIVEEQKLRVNDNNVVGAKSEIQLSLEDFLEKGKKRKFGDLILIIKNS